MLQALRAGKIDQWLTKNPWQIEDLLTAVVFGSCDYAGREGWTAALHPFLAQAVHSSNRTHKLAALLPSPQSTRIVSYEFWPDLDRFEHKSESSETNHKPVIIRAASPELIIRLEDEKQRKFFILVEVKLNIGKSAGPSDSADEVADQLAKYWMQLMRLARREGGEPLAAVYVTPWSFPADEMRETHTELMKCGVEGAPIFWISWRDFVSAVENHAAETYSSLPRLIDEVCQLLRDKWGLVRAEAPKAWPVLPALPKISALSIDFPWKSVGHQVPALLTVDWKKFVTEFNVNEGCFDKTNYGGVWQFAD